MHVLDALGDPVRRRLVELLAERDRTAGDLGVIVQAEFAITQPAVSQHLRTLREHGIVSATADGRHRLYHLQRGKLAEIDTWLVGLRSLWESPLDALATEIARGKRKRRNPDSSHESREAG